MMRMETFLSLQRFQEGRPQKKPAHKFFCLIATLRSHLSLLMNRR